MTFTITDSKGRGITETRIIRLSAPPPGNYDILAVELDRYGHKIPRRGDQIDLNGKKLEITSISYSKVDDSPIAWELNITYGTTSAASRPETPPKPWELPPVIVATPYPDWTDYFDCAMNGNSNDRTDPLILPTGNAINPLPPCPHYRTRVEISWYLQGGGSAPFGILDPALGSINESAVTIDGESCPANTLLLLNAQSTGRVIDGAECWECKAELLFDPAGHLFRAVARDFYAKFNGKLARIAVDAAGAMVPYDPSNSSAARPVEIPQMIDETGVITTTPYIIEKRMLPYMSWNHLHIPTVKGRRDE